MQIVCKCIYQVIPLRGKKKKKKNLGDFDPFLSKNSTIYYYFPLTLFCKEWIQNFFVVLGLLEMVEKRP